MKQKENESNHNHFVECDVMVREQYEKEGGDGKSHVF